MHLPKTRTDGQLRAPKVSFNPSFCENFANFASKLRNVAIREQPNRVLFGSCAVKRLWLAFDMSQNSQFALSLFAVKSFYRERQSLLIIATEILSKKISM